MNFSDLLERKIQERRPGFIQAVHAAQDADARLRDRLAPLRAAVTEMVDELLSNPVFANVMGRPSVTITRDDEDGRAGALQFEFSAGILSFNTYASKKIQITLDISKEIKTSLKCSRRYGDGVEVHQLSNIVHIIDHARAHLADFLADICLSTEF